MERLYRDDHHLEDAGNLAATTHGEDFFPVFDVEEVFDVDSGVTYYPILGGWRAEKDSGSTEYIYLNPSGGSDDGVPTVFLYQGANGDPAQDEAVVHVVVFDK
jgi:hypothetical protein